MSVTLQTIAEQLDISAATVSRSLRQDRLIHPKTRARVNEMALRLGYTERSRRPRNKTEGGTLGFLLRMNTLADAKQDPNVMRMMEGVMSGADSMGLLLNVHGMAFSDTRHISKDASAIPPMIRDHVCHATIVHGDFAAEDIGFLAQQMPVVCLNRIYRHVSSSSVVADDAEGVRALVEQMIEQGHRRFIWINDYYDASYFEARQSGLVQACFSHKLDLKQQLFLGAESFQGRTFGALDVLIEAIRNGATGIVCANDFVALPIMRALESAGIHVPSDVSVVGFDAISTEPEGLKITSFDPNFFEIGRAAVRLVAQHLEFPTSLPSILSIRGQVVDGLTVGPANN